MTIQRVFIASLCIISCTCMAYTIPQCGPDGKLEINDTTAEVTIRCTGIGDDRVYMSISRSDGTPKTITSCSAELCHSDSDFKVTREDNAIHVVKKGNVQSRDTLAGTLKCGRLGSASPAASCRLRVVYDAEKVENCITEVNEDWALSGSCQVNKMFASDGHYGCSWSSIGQRGQPSEFSGQMEVTSTFTDNGKTYHRGLCSFAGQPMPTTAGHYVYHVKIDPGTEYFPGAGTDIKPPEGDPYMSYCPTQLVEGDSLNCTCHVSSSNPGSPPAIVSWSDPPEIASSLVIHSVTRSQDGRVFACRQYWGGYNTSFGQEAKHTLHVNSSSPTPSPATSTTRVTDTGGEKDSDDNSIPVAFIIGGAAGGLVLIIVIIVVIIVCRKRKAKSLHAGKTERSNQEDDELVEHINNFYVSADEVESLQPASSAATRQPPPARPGGNETSFNVSSVSPLLHQASASDDPSGSHLVDAHLYSSADDYGIDEAAGENETTDKPTAHKTEKAQIEIYSVVDKSRKTQRKEERKEKKMQQTSQAASSAGAEATQQHNDGQGDGTPGDLCSVVQKQKPSSKTSVKQTTPGPAEPTVPPSLPPTGTEEKPEVGSDEYGRLNFHRRASTELPGNQDTVYSHIGAP